MKQYILFHLSYLFRILYFVCVFVCRAVALNFSSSKTCETCKNGVCAQHVCAQLCVYVCVQVCVFIRHCLIVQLRSTDGCVSIVTRLGSYGGL